MNVARILKKVRLHLASWGPLKEKRRYISDVPFQEIIGGYQPVPYKFNFVKDVFEPQANNIKSGDVPALWHVDVDGSERIWSYHDLNTVSARVASMLLELGVRPHDRVIVIVPKVPAFWMLNLALIRLGALMLPGTSQLSTKDIDHRLMMSQATCMICSESTAKKVNEVAGKHSNLNLKIVVGAQDHHHYSMGWLDFDFLLSRAYPLKHCYDSLSHESSQLFFTSGTTGMPKITVHSQVSYGVGHWCTGKLFCDLSQADVFWNLADTGWAKSAYSSIFGPWICGATVFVHAMPQFDESMMLQTLMNYPINVLCAPPTAFRMVIQQDLKKYHFPTLRHCVTGGEPLNWEVQQRWKESLGFEMKEGYGQTETVLCCGTTKDMESREGSMGKSIYGYDVKVVGERGEELPPYEEGMIGIKTYPHRPVGLFTGYLDDPVRTRAAYRGNFYLTGDKAYCDEDGYIFFIGRADDVIISSGYRIGPFEVESALLEHPAVAESAVVASPDLTRGEIVKAFVVLTQNYVGSIQSPLQKDDLIRDLQNHVKKVTAPYKYPRKIEFVESLPKTVSGKIRRVELRKKEFGQG